MKKIVILVAACTLLAAACSKATVQSQATVSTNPTPTTAAVSSQGSFRQLMALGKAQKCQVNFQQSDGSLSQGTVYVDPAGKFRGDFSATVQGHQVMSHVIADSETVYTWSDASNMGMKMAIVKPTPTGTTSSQGVSMDQQVQYNCQNWSEDSSVFTPPANVTFQDESQMMQQMTMPKNSPAMAPGTSSGNAAMCAACDNAGAGKAQCLAAMGCK